jgi:L,D-peptidoglycan transpeptidase YkuD (ErfK/YbiS/YcfS/YnhG family)
MRVTRWGVSYYGRHFPASIGKGGIRGNKREGDGATPLGGHHVVGMYYRSDRVRAPVTWAVPIGPGDLWSDDMADTAYNSHVQSPYPHSHEHLRRADPLYDIIIVTDWNWPDAIPGFGSAIFMHQWRKPRHPTEGCVAFRRDHLMWIAERLQIGTRIVVTQP